MPKLRDGRRSGTPSRIRSLRRSSSTGHRSRPAHRCVVDRGDKGFDDVLGGPRDLRIYAGLPLQRHVGLGQRAALRRWTVSASYADIDGDVLAGLTPDMVRDTLITRCTTSRPDARCGPRRRGGDWVPWPGWSIAARSSIDHRVTSRTTPAGRPGSGPHRCRASRWLQHRPSRRPGRQRLSVERGLPQLALPPRPPTPRCRGADFPVVTGRARPSPRRPPERTSHYRSVADTYLIETSDDPRHFGRRGVPTTPWSTSLPRTRIDMRSCAPARSPHRTAFPDSAPAPIRSPSGRPPSISSCSHTLTTVLGWCRTADHRLSLGGRPEVRWTRSGRTVERIRSTLRDRRRDRWTARASTAVPMRPSSTWVQLTSSSRTGWSPGLHEGRRPRIGRMERSVPRVEIDGRR